MEAFSIASAVVSVILGAYAIWLSIVFYRMSIQSSNQIQGSAKDLSSSVSKLEKLFEHLYSDTFSMMRDTYSDMRRHVWPEAAKQEPEIASQIEARADLKIDAIHAELMERIETIAARVGGAEMKADELRSDLLQLTDDAISRSRNAEVEAQEETLRDVLLNQVKSAGTEGIRAVDLMMFIRGEKRGWAYHFASELAKLKEEGLIDYDGASTGFPRHAGDRIVYTPESPPRKRK